jgi:hypothetical protein
VNGRLRRSYRRLLVVYPPAYRAARGDEILTTLLEGARPGQRFPTAREAAGLVLGGLRARARQAAVDPPARPWTDGLHLGVILIGLVNLGTVAITMTLPWTLLVAVGTVAALRGRARIALVATTAAALVVARPVLALSFGLHSFGLPWWLPGYGDWSAVARYALPALLLAVLARPGAARLRPHSWWWLLLPVVQLAVPPSSTWRLAEAGVQVALALGVLLVTVGLRDPRPAVAAAVYLTPGLLFAAERLSRGPVGPRMLAYWTVLAGLTAVLVAAAAWRTSRPGGAGG